ncbi:condensation domain-containing protein [Sphaerisporangium sp. B11E5]|uniref:condensation domain-containing protein n=1 Tax=Sphaerisporangium sp. B11E5 TaxID=3153563 RepID=UPI00325D9BFF
MSISEATSPILADVTERVPLSFNQEFLVMFSSGEEEGPFGPQYNIVCGWRVGGLVDTAVLRDALGDLVVRHEALRTSIVNDPTGRYQQIFPPGSPELTVRDLRGVAPADRDQAAGELVNEAEAGSYSIRDLPLLRAVFGRFDASDGVLVLIAHHTAVDEWSMRLLMRDLAALYAMRRGHPVELPDARQYQEYARWQLTSAAEAPGTRARQYWREKLRGACITATTTDHRRSEHLPKTTSWHRFAIPAESTSAILKLSRETRSSPFMILFAAYSVLLHRMTGSTDIVVPTFSSGRAQARFHNTVGSFFNFMPLRTDIEGCETFRQVVERARVTCMEAYSHDIPFAHVLEEAPTLMSPLVEDDKAVCAFQVFRSPVPGDHEVVGDLEYSEIPRRLDQPIGGDVPDGALWQMEIDSSGEIVATLGFNSNLFAERTFTGMAAEFRRILDEAVATPDAPLQRI